MKFFIFLLLTLKENYISISYFKATPPTLFLKETLGENRDILNKKLREFPTVIL